MLETVVPVAISEGDVKTRAGFRDRLRDAAQLANSLVCVGLDPNPDRMPPHIWESDDVKGSIVRFNRGIVEATADLVCAYKPNLGFYAALGLDGLAALVETRELIPSHIPVILDCKTNDMGDTARGYARGYFDEWDFDAITVNPYMGEDSLQPYLECEGRGVIVLCKTSNPGSGDFQDRSLGAGERPLFMDVAARAADWEGRYPASVGLVVGATYPSQLAEVRAQCPELPILLPGIGSQGGDLEGAVSAGVGQDGLDLMVSSSRGITYAGTGPDFASKSRNAAMELRDAINRVRLGAYAQDC